MLIISSDTDPVYAEHRKVWSSYMNSNPCIDSYFIQYREGPQQLVGNTFWLPGKESFKGIITKTIDSIEYFLKKKDYDYIVRTNMSSLWNFDALLSFLNTLPKERVYSGVIGNHHGIQFASGSGFIMTKDIANLLISNRNTAEAVGIIDDVDIGYTMKTLGVHILPGRRTDFYSMEMYLSHTYNPSTYHYRIKWTNNNLRSEEAVAMKFLLSEKMKLGTVVTACDSNTLYCDFIPIFIKAWKTLFPHVDIVIVLVAHEIPDNLKEYSEYIRLSKPIEGIHTAFHAQCIRLLYPRHIARDEGVLITDMDMLPMNRFYYEGPISNLSNDMFIAYRNILLPNEIPICYNIATPSVWSKVFGDKSDEDMLKEWHTPTYDGKHGGKGWNTDQVILIKKFNGYSGPKIILNDTLTKFRRLDRQPGFSVSETLKTEIKNGVYSDYHCMRPYSVHKDINDFIVQSLNS